MDVHGGGVSGQSFCVSHERQRWKIQPDIEQKVYVDKQTKTYLPDRRSGQIMQRRT